MRYRGYITPELLKLVEYGIRWVRFSTNAAGRFYTDPEKAEILQSWGRGDWTYVWEQHHVEPGLQAVYAVQEIVDGLRRLTALDPEGELDDLLYDRRLPTVVDLSKTVLNPL